MTRVTEEGEKSEHLFSSTIRPIGTERLVWRVAANEGHACAAGRLMRQISKAKDKPVAVEELFHPVKARRRRRWR